MKTRYSILKKVFFQFCYFLGIFFIRRGGGLNAFFQFFVPMELVYTLQTLVFACAIVRTITLTADIVICFENHGFYIGWT